MFSHRFVGFAASRRMKSSFVAMLCLLTAGLASAQILSPASKTLQSTVGAASTAGLFTLTNNQTSALTISGIGVPTGFAVNATTCPVAPATLGVGLSCTLSVTFTPAETGAVSGTLAISSSGNNSPNGAALTGVGTTGGATSVAPYLLNYAGRVVGTTSPAAYVTFTNNGASPLSITSVQINGNSFATATGTGQCTATLNAGKSCRIYVTATPAALGSNPGTLTISDSVDASPVTVDLLIAGLSDISLNGTNINLGSWALGTTSAPLYLTLTNNQTTPLTISSIQASPTSTFTVAPGSTCLSGTVAAGASCTVGATMTPQGLGPQSGSISINNNSSQGPVNLTLSGTGVAQAVASPSSVNFGTQVSGTTSALHVVTLKNNLSGALTISSLAVTSGTPFSIDPSSTCLTPTVAAGAACTVALAFAPTSATASNGSLTIMDSAANSPQTVPLSGNGIAPATLAPSSLSFGSWAIGAPSSAKTITLKNNMTSVLSLTQVLFNGPFSLDTSPSSATTCPTGGGPVAAGASCVIGIIFTPSAVQNYNGQITVIDSAGNSPQTAALHGSGIVPASLSPNLNFGNVVVGTASAAQNVTLVNHQAVPLNLASLTTALPYAISTGTTTCVVGTPVPPGGNCVIGVSMTPATVGNQPAGSLSVIDDASNSPQSVTLNGRGIGALTFTPANLAFGNVLLNSPVTQSITVQNNQAVPVTLTSVTGFTTGYTEQPTSTCPISPAALGAGQSCTLAIQLNPPVPGVYHATIAVQDNGAASPQMFSLTGTATAPVATSPTSYTFPAQYEGATSLPKTFVLTNEQSVPLNLTGASITGANSSDFTLTTNCPTVPTSIPAHSSCDLFVTFTPSGSGTRAGSIAVVDDAPGSPQVVPISGPGNAPILLSPNLITNFGANVGTTSANKALTVKNNDTVIHTISSIQLTGDYKQTATTCPISPNTLAAGASCSISVSFAPTLGGVRAGQLLLYDDAITSPQVANFSGTGSLPLTLSSGGRTFSAQKIGTISPPQNVTLTNHEAESETFTLTTVGEFIANSNCASGVIAANSTCNVSINFAPTTTGALTGSVTVTDSAPGGSPLVINLSGSGTTANPPAAVMVVSPGAGTAGTVVNAVITGNGWTNFGPTSVVTFDNPSSTIPNGIAVTLPNPASNTANTINAQFNIAANAIPGARNIRVVTGSQTARLTAAFIIADTSNSHIINTALPNVGSQGQTLNVALTATGTNFVQGATFANFGDGIVVNSLVINTPTTATANITISNTTFIGYRTITLVTGGEYAGSGPQAFQILRNSAALVSVTPNTSPQGANLAVNVVATGTHFQQNATTFAFTGGINVGNVQVNSPTTATVNLAVTQGATVGVQNMSVATGGELATLANAFTVTGSTPYLVSVTPSSGQQGQTENITITGQYTNFNAANLVATLGGDITVNSYNVVSPTQVVVNITISNDAAVNSRTAQLTSGPTGGETIFPFTFTVLPSSAAIVSVTPSSVPQGGQLTLAVVGQNTHWIQGTTTSAFYPDPNTEISVDEITVTDSTHATLNISVPPGQTLGPNGFYMATGGEVVTSSVSVYANTPTLSMSPANGMPGAAMSVAFTGQFTHFGPTTLAVVSGQGVTLQNLVFSSNVSAQAKLVIDPTATPGLREITFTTGGEIVTTYFNVVTTPAYLVTISPYHSPQGTSLNVEITGAYTHFTAGTTVVNIDPQIAVNSTTVSTATDLVSNITISPTATIGWHTVYVNTGNEQVIIGFYVDGPQAPTIVSVVPGSAAQGAEENVVITGSLTNWVQGQTELILGAGVTVSNFTVTGPTTATATISVSPTAPVGGDAVITITGSEVVSGTAFSVTPSAAEISIVQPTCSQQITIAYVPCNAPNGPPVVSQLQTISLGITGIDTHWVQGETMASFGSGVITDHLIINSPTSATVQITVLSNSPVGFASLTMSTDGENVTLQQAIDIEEGFPTLLSTSPAGGLQGATLNLQLLGRFTHWQQGVTTAAFNKDITVNYVTVIDSDSAVANVTVSPLAYIDLDCAPSGHTITITTGSEQETLPGTFCVGRGPAQVTLVNPALGVQGSTETVAITGSETHWVAGETVASFEGGINVGNVTVTSPTTATVALAVTTAAPTGFSNVTMTTLGEIATQQFAFQVTPGVATLNEAIPNQAEQGVQNLNVHLIGQYSHFNANSTATFGQGITVNSVTYTDATDLIVNISISPLAFIGTETVTVTSPGVPCQYLADTYNACPQGATTGSEIVSDNAFSIIAGPAIITTVAPGGGNQGQEIILNITGSNTNWAQNITQFWIPGAGSDITINSVVINSPTSATADVTISPTAGLGARSIYMVTAGEALTDGGAFVVTGGIPVITYLTPNNAPPGTNQLDVTIHGLYTNWGPTTTVSFGPGVTVTQVQVESSTAINAIINIDPSAQQGYRTVFVQTGAQGLTSNFQVYSPPPPVPYISYFWPSSGLPGQTFTVSFTGQYTHWDPATTTPTFGDGITVNTFQVLSPTSAIANITISPTTYAGTRLVTLTTGAEVDGTDFNVVIAQPVLSVVDPGSGIQGNASLNVNIIGQYTVFDNTTVFNFGQGVTVNNVQILGPTIATVNVSIAQLAQLGGRSVTATTGGVTVGGAGFSVTPSLALISAIMPNTSEQGQVVVVSVTGQNTHWSPATVFQLGSGIVVANAVVNSPTSATLTLSIPALAPVGPTGASATTLGEVATITNGFVVQAGTPLLLSAGPGNVQQQSSVTFTVLSQATHWTSNPPMVNYGTGITLTNMQVTGDTSLTVEGYVQPTTTVGYRNLTVTTGTQILSLPYAVYVNNGPAVVNAVSPTTAGQGANLNVAITGINTHWVQGVTQLTFPQVLVNSFTVTSPTTATANITVSTYATPGLVNVTLTTLGEVASKSNAFEITQTQPEMLYINSATGAQGLTETATITALYTNFDATTTASFGTGITVNSVTPLTPTSLQANITIAPTTSLGYRNVSVTTGTQAISSTSLFQVVAGPANIVSVSPSSGGEGQSLTVLVTASQTHFAQGTTTAAFGGGIGVTALTVVDALHANVTISIPNSTPVGAYNVVLTTGGEVATELGGFQVTSGTASIAVVNPPSGPQGSVNQNIALTGLFTSWINNTSVASFGAGVTVNSLTVSDATDAVANITISPTAAIGSRTVTVTTNGQVATIVGGFSVLAGVPALISALPTSAQAGSSANVVITGQFTTFQSATPSVSFGSGITVNSVAVASETQLTANITVASNASVGTRTISVTTGAQNVSLPNGFSVLAGTPVLTQINPNIGTPGANVSVTLYGLYTAWTSGTTSVNFGAGVTVNSLTVNSTTQLTASLTVGSAAAVGPRTVIVTTGGEIENVPAGFTVQPAVISPPTVISLSPGPNAGGMPINSSITAVFSQPMSRPTFTATSVLLYLTSNPGQGYIPVAGTITLDASGRVLTFAPTAQLAVNSTYLFQITNAVQDATGNALGYYSQNLYTTFSANTTPPTVTSVNPPPNATLVGTNASIQIAFSADMNQWTQTGLTVSTGGNPIAGTYSWNSDATCCSWGPGTILTFTPAAPLASSTTYTVGYGAPLADTAGNALGAGSFSFTTGLAADTTNNSTSVDFGYFQQNLGTNFAPTMFYAKPVNPIDINTGTLFLYNYDSGKYIQGTVSVAANGLSAQFTPNMPLLPQTAYSFYQSGGYYDMDGVYLNGGSYYFITGPGSATTPPAVASINPVDGSTGIPLNAQIVLHFSEPLNSPLINQLRVTPAGGSALPGTATLASDQVTLTFVPTATLTPNTVYTVAISGYQDLNGNTGTAFSSSFTTAASVAPLNLGTGYTSGGVLSTVNNTPDANWTVTPTGSSTSQPAEVVGPGDTGWYGGWPANGPKSSWITLNPESVSGNTFGTYSRTFNLTGYNLNNLCFVGAMGVDDNGALAINGTPIMNQISAIGSLTPLNIPLTPSILNAGVNTLSLVWGSTDNYYEAFRLQGSIQTCGATLTGGLTVTSATPSNSSTNVPTNSTITLTFNNPLDPATVSDTTLPVMVGWNSNQIIAGTWAVSGATATFTPDSPFPASTQIYVGNCNGPYDTAGDTINGCYDDQIVQFTTGSTVTPPANPFQVTAFSPASNATNVGLRANVTATFNRSFNPGTINPNDANTDFALYSGDTLDCTSYNRSSDNTTLSFNCFALPSNTVMTALVNSSLQDFAGNGAANFRSQFTTAPTDSNTHGSINTTRPGNGSTGIGVDSALVLYTSLPVLASTANAGLQVAQNNVPLPGTVQVLDNGYSIVFTPSSPLTPGALIQWWITSALTDATYGSAFNTTNGYFYVAANTSTAAPAINAASPALYSNSIPLNSVFDFQFNVPLNASTVTPTNIYLYDSHTGLHVAATYSMPQPNEVRIVPTSDVSPSAYIYLYVTTGLQSTTSVPAQTNSWYFYTGTSDDTTLPMVVSWVPYSGAGNIGVNVSPSVVFNKTIDPVSINSTTFQVTNAGTPLAGTYYINNNDTRISFVPNDPLPASTTLKMVLNGVTDVVGHSVTLNSTFQTQAGPDFQAPTVVWTSIPNNGTVPINSTVTVRFSESMDITTFTSNNLHIYDYTLGTYIAATLTWSGDQSVAYLTPAAPLAAGRQYNLYVESGTDLAGNTLQGTSYTFYAGFANATTAPTVVAVDPLSGAANVGINTVIEAQFSASIDPNTLGGVTLSTGGSTVPITPVLSAGNTIVQLVPSAPLQASTTYTITISGVKDPAGNVVATTTSTFTTGTTLDINGPSVTTYNPPYNSTVGTNVLPKFVFNKPLNPITVNGNTFRMSLNDTGQGVPLTVTPSANGLEVTLTPQVPLLPSSQYLVQACCGFHDLVGNNGNGSSVYFYTGAGADTTAPTVSFSPTSSATGIPLNAQILVIANKPIDPTSWTQSSVQLFDNLNHPVAGTVSAPSSTSLSFVPTAALNPGVAYTIKVSAFTDAMENAVVPVSSTFTTGTAASTTGLTLTSTNIPFGSTNVSATQQIVLTFSQILDPATVNASTLKVMDSWNSNYPLSGTYTVSGNQVTFTPTSPYAAGASIYVGECGGPTDVLGEVFQNGNCYSQQLVYFTVTTANPDTTPLSVLSVSPAAGAANVGVNSPVSITFNKAINPYSVNSTNALLFAGQGIQDQGGITLSADGRTITFNIGALYGGTAYTISLPAGGISDPSGNTLASAFESTFTTLSYPETGNGSVQSTNPTNNATGVPTGNILTLYMNRPVNPATLPGNVSVTVNGSVYAGTLAATAGNLEIQFTPTVPFPNGAVVQWFFSNVYDAYGNAFYSTSGTFYIVSTPNPTAAPQQTVVSPSYGSTNVPTNAEIDIAFNLPLNPATLGGAINFNGGASATVSLASPNVIRIVPTTAFSATTFYYVCTNGSLQGTDGTAIQTACYSTYFTTTASGPDTIPGTVKIGPPNSSVAVGTNAYIRLYFSKPVDASTINSTNVQVTTGGNPIPGTFSYAYTNNDVLQVNFSPVNPLPPSSIIKVTTSNLLDYAGNTFTPATSTFTTAATPDLSQASVSYEFGGNTQNIGTNAAFTCLYTKPMDPSSFTPNNVYIYDYATNKNIPITYTFASDLMAVTLTPNSPLTPNTQYNYECFNAIDLTGNGQSDNGGPYFTTGSGPSTTAPQLLYANPPNGVTGVALNDNNGPWYSTSLMLQFSESLAENSIGSVTLTPQGGSPLATTNHLELGDTTLVMQLPAELMPSTTYTFNVTGVTDYNGNPIAPTTSTFTTGTGYDFNNPSVSSFSPANGATAVPAGTTPTITFSEPMNPILAQGAQVYLRNHNTSAVIPTTLSFNSTYTTVTLTPTAPLAASTIYDIVETPSSWYLEDWAGNNLYNTNTSTFTTAP
jgi:hypothetical protein